MCKAKNHVKELKEVMDKIQGDYKEYKQKVKINDLTQLDMLHALEDMDKMSASQGYMMAKALRDLRIERRKDKNEFKTLETLNSMFVEPNTKRLNDTYNNVIAEEKTLMYLTENKIYKQRVVNGKIVEHGNRYNKSNSYSNNYRNKKNKNKKNNQYVDVFVPNAKYNRPKSKLHLADVMVVGSVGNCHECFIMNTDGVIVKNNIMKKFIILQPK